MPREPFWHSSNGQVQLLVANSRSIRPSNLQEQAVRRLFPHPVLVLAQESVHLPSGAKIMSVRSFPS